MFLFTKMKPCAVIVFVCYIAGAFASSSDSKVGIYDGKTTTIESFPFIVAIFNNDNFICAGTIVSENWLVTTANCVNSTSDVSSLSVVAGSNDTVTGTTYLVNQTVQHPLYDSETYDYEYSLVQINGTFTWSDSVKAALLPTSDPCPFSTVTAVGYGATTSSSTGGSAQLREGSMKWWPKFFCKTMLTIASITLTDRMACGYNVAHTTLCSGDLADPFVKDGVFYGQFAYSASLMACTSGATPVVLADILPVADWISGITQASFQQE